MSVQKVREHLKRFGLDGRVSEFGVSTATVGEASLALGVIPARIAKTLAFRVPEGGCMLILTAGDARMDNKKGKARFGHKLTMLSHEDALKYTGHAIGGVCPFAIPGNIPVYLDISLRRFDTVFPAAGSAASSVRLTCPELELASGARAWVDVCKDWE